MDLLSAVFLGVLQGVAEWLPVSSSAQNIFVLVGFLGLDPQSAFSFSSFLHLGTLLAALVRFRLELYSAFKDFVKKKKSKLVSFMFWATLFSAIAGLPMYVFLKDFFLESQGMVVTGLAGILLIATGFVLHYSRKNFGDRTVDNSNSPDGILAGFFQGIAVLPGISRSGVTSAALFLRGFKPEEALKLTFIISIPAVLGLLGVEALKGGLLAIDFKAGLVGVLVSFIAGYLTIDILIKLANKIRFDLFCIIFGLIAALLSLGPFLLK